LREAIGEMIYGCDICQDVCPWNISFARELKEDQFGPRSLFDGRNARDVAIELLTMNDDSYAEGLRGSPMKRAKLRGLARNAAVVLGNVGEPHDVALLDARGADSDPMLREHFDWARRRIVMRGSDSEPRSR
jgi:epoxyqueuosine reductase